MLQRRSVGAGVRRRTPGDTFAHPPPCEGQGHRQVVAGAFKAQVSARGRPRFELGQFADKSFDTGGVGLDHKRPAVEQDLQAGDEIALWDAVINPVRAFIEPSGDLGWNQAAREFGGPKQFDDGSSDASGVDNECATGETGVAHEFGDAIDYGRERHAEADAFGVTEPNCGAADEIKRDRVPLACDFVEVLEDSDRGIVTALSDVQADDPVRCRRRGEVGSNYHKASKLEVRRARICASSKRAPSAQTNSQQYSCR